MYIIRDDNSIEMVRGDTAKIDILVKTFDEVDTPVKEELPTYFEIINGDFVKTKDTQIVEGKQYYVIIDYELREGDELIFTVKKNTKTDEILFQKRGTFISIESEDTESCKYGTYKYDVQFSGANGCVDTIIRPTNFIITEEVTW